MQFIYRQRGFRGKKSKPIPEGEETTLAECLITMEKWGWGLTMQEIFQIVEDYVTRNGIKTPFKNEKIGF